MYKVEPLSPDTLDWFVHVAARNMVVEELKRPELMDSETHYNLCSAMMNQGSGWVCVKDGELVGGLGSLLIPHLYNPRYKTLVELFWYVVPEHRSSKAGSLLLQAFEEKGREADDCILSLLPSSNVTGLERRGFIKSEESYRKVM